MVGKESALAAEVAEFSRTFPPSITVREALGQLVEDTYPECGRPIPYSLTSRITSSETPLVEVAHDGQLPHLGIVRLVLKSAQVAKLSDGVAIYLIGDHYSAEIRPRNVLVGMPLRGRNPDEVKQPLRLPIHGSDKEVSFMYLPPPSLAEIDTLHSRTWDWFEKNIAYERSLGNRIEALDKLRERISLWYDRLGQESVAAGSLGNWMIRVQMRFIEEILGTKDLPLVVLPMSRFRSLIAAELREIIGSPRAQSDGPKAGIWVHCPRCKVRGRPDMTGSQVHFLCGRCRSEVEEPLDPAGPHQFPDIVSFEAAALQVFSGWVVGSNAEYLPSIDRIYEDRRGTRSPPRAVLSSVPFFKGIGEPPEGYGRSRVLRVLFEVDGPAFRDALLSPWMQNPRIASPYLLMAE